VRSSASSFNLQYPLLYLRPSSSYLCLPPRPPSTSTHPSIFPSITCFRRQFLRTIWPTQLAFVFLWYAGYFSPLWLYVKFFISRMICPTVFSNLLQHHISKVRSYFWYTFYGAELYFSASIHTNRETLGFIVSFQHLYTHSDRATASTTLCAGLAASIP